MIINKKISTIILAGIFMSGCASTTAKRQAAKEVILPEIDVVQVKEKSDEALKLAQEVKIDMEVVNTKLTEIDNRLMALSEEIANISAAKIEELDSRQALLTEAYKDLLVQIKALQAALANARARGADPATFSTASAASLLVSPEYNAYRNGLRSFNERNYDQAAKAFGDLLVQFPNGKYAADAQFWIGESYYSLGNYSSAVAAYQKVIAFPSSGKADNAQYKLGLSYLKLGQQSAAKDAFKMLVERYPGSDHAVQAQKHLKQLK